MLAGAAPPKAKADVEVPAPAKPFLATLTSFTSVQFVPFHNSVSVARLGLKS